MYLTQVAVKFILQEPEGMTEDENQSPKGMTALTASLTVAAVQQPKPVPESPVSSQLPGSLRLAAMPVGCPRALEVPSAPLPSVPSVPPRPSHSRGKARAHTDQDTKDQPTQSTDGKTELHAARCKRQIGRLQQQ